MLHDFDVGRANNNLIIAWQDRDEDRRLAAGENIVDQVLVGFSGRAAELLESLNLFCRESLNRLRGLKQWLLLYAGVPSTKTPDSGASSDAHAKAATASESATKSAAEPSATKSAAAEPTTSESAASESTTSESAAAATEASATSTIRV